MNDNRHPPRRRPDDDLTDDEILRLDEEAEPLEIISLDVDEEGEEVLDLDAETAVDLLHDAQEEAYAEEVSWYTDDETIQEALEERQDLNNGQEELLEELEDYNSKSPQLSGGDVDAAWDDANVGEETVGGAAPTPDQDVVDELGEALGITYEDDEPLHTEEKLEERDRHRWELDPESAEEENS